MKIDKIILYHINLPLIEPFITGFGKIDVRETLIIEAHSGDYVGYGESPHLHLPIYTSEYLEGGKKLLLKHILPRFIGKEIINPKEIRKIYADLKGNNISKAGIEMAIRDLFAKKDNLALYKYLGSERNFSEVGISIGLQKDAESLLNKIKIELKDGYKRIKIKIKPGSDLLLLEKIRNEFPDLKLMVDTNSSYSLENIDDIKKMDKFGLMMIEQPLGESDIIDHSYLQNKLDTPICLDESIHTFDDARKAIEMKSCKIINIKPARLGGIGEILDIHNLCLKNDIPLWIGGMMESGIGVAFLNHIATLKGFTLPGDNVPQKMYFKDDIVDNHAIFENGINTVSESPGIGVNINKEKMKNFLIDKNILE